MAGAAPAFSVADVLTPGRVLADLPAADKAGLLRTLARRLAADAGLGDDIVTAALLAREDLGSTGVGGGVALPHARLAPVTRPLGLFARLAAPIAFDAVDERKVDLVFALLLPARDGGGPLQALACVSRALRDPDRLAALRRVPADPGVLHSVLAAT